MLFIKPYFRRVAQSQNYLFRRFSSLVAGILLVGLFSCNTGVLFEKNIPLESGTWPMNNKLTFEVSIQDTTLPYDFYLNLRHNDDYEFSNLFLFIDTYYPNAAYTRDTVEILLANAAGQWFGEGFGELKEIRVLLKKQVYFPAAGNYTFSVAQAMRAENLKGIEDFGIRIEKIQQ
jgi:gliding motility-associated lipoprotein GldH